MPTFQPDAHSSGLKPSLLTNANLKALKSFPLVLFKWTEHLKKILTGT